MRWQSREGVRACGLEEDQRVALPAQIAAGEQLDAEEVQAVI